MTGTGGARLREDVCPELGRGHAEGASRGLEDRDGGPHRSCEDFIWLHYDLREAGAGDAARRPPVVAASHWVLSTRVRRGATDTF